MDIQILDNEVNTEFKKKIMKDWGATYQLVPPNVHRRNIAERAIRTFKAHFLAHKTKEIHIWDQPISKLYTDDFGRFPIRSRIGNK